MTRNFINSVTQRLPEDAATLRKVSQAKLAHLIAEVGSTPQVMFVCLGNICRSPFAARLLAARLGDAADVSSAGTLMLSDRPSPVDALTIAPQFGVQLDDHRSQFVDTDAAARADVIFIFDDRNASELAQLGVDEDRTIRLGALIGQRTIADPYALGTAAFEACYTQISESVDVVAAAVRGR